MASIETRSTWGGGFIAGLSAKVMEAENQADEAYAIANEQTLGIEQNTSTNLFKKRTTDQARETIISKTGFKRAVETAEGANFEQDTRVPAYQVQLNPIKKTDSVDVTLEARNDRDKDIADTMDEIRDLKISYMQTINEDDFSIFGYGYTAQASLPNSLSFYADGVPVFSTIHPIKKTTTSNTTQSNASTTGITYTEANQETGRQALVNQKDDRDLMQSYGSGNIILLVPTALEKNAMIVNKSKLRSGTANNDMNIYDGNITVMSTKWVGSEALQGSDTQWQLIDSMRSPFFHLEREPYTPSTWTENRNKNFVYDFYARYQTGNKNWRGAWGSQGDGASYTS